MKKKIFSLIFFFFLTSRETLLWADVLSSLDKQESTQKSQEFVYSSHYDIKDPLRPRSDVLMPLATFFLPGLDQWIESQYAFAGIYTGGALVGLSISYSLNKKLQAELPKQPPEPGAKEIEFDLFSKDLKKRLYMLSAQSYITFGGLSLYHSFKSSVRSRRSHGQYTFLNTEESISKLSLAPFQFHFLKSPTTWVGLGAGVLAGVFVYVSTKELLEKGSEKRKRSSFTLADAFFAPAFSYNAGLWEEATFRGWMMPVFKEYIGSDFFSNILSSALFAAAHISKANPVPLVQFFLGAYWGWVSQRNEWTLSETIFQHFWYDVIVFSTYYSLLESVDSSKIHAVKPTIMLPPLTFVF